MTMMSRQRAQPKTLSHRRLVYFMLVLCALLVASTHSAKPSPRGKAPRRSSTGSRPKKRSSSSRSKRSSRPREAPSRWDDEADRSESTRNFDGEPRRYNDDINDDNGFERDGDDEGNYGMTNEQTPSFGLPKRDGLSSGAGKNALYDAYNTLHTLAQEFKKPFDAPAVVVVGHQSSGKSALIEALMGFQFNQVGGGTKTRRPVALRMQYNPSCLEPRWFLVGEDGIERPMSLFSIQDYIEKENRRLERDPVRSFDSREINIRMEYKHCPNMILIDTPGLISAPKIAKGRSTRGGSGAALAQQKALIASAREAEKLVIEKMRCEDYIILCVEDTSDWKHGITREVVQKADPDLSRTVIVNTKFDTKVPQFGAPSDIEDFLRATILEKVAPHTLGGPYFTSVPSGRVAHSEEEMNRGECLFDNDEEFVQACADGENSDRSVVIQRLSRSGKAKELSNAGMTERIGLSKLRKFLEQRVDECYRRNVQKIIPMLQAEHTTADRRLKACTKELEALSVERLKEGADAFCDEFCQCLRKAMKGTILAPVDLFGETLIQETTNAGSFHDIPGSAMAVSLRTWERLVETEVGNQQHRLYGGSQYHRALREFHLATRCLRLPSISEDEIANAAGIGESHDGANFLHASCVIAVEKARLTFEPVLHALQLRMTHVMDRLCPVSEYMLREGRERTKLGQTSWEAEQGGAKLELVEHAMDISQNPQFRQLIRSIFEKFVRRCSDATMAKCRDDLTAITKYVSWSLNEGGNAAITSALPDQTNVIQVYQVALEKSGSVSKKDGDSEPDSKESKKDSDSRKEAEAKKEAERDEALTPVLTRDKNENRDYRNLVKIMEEAMLSRDSNRTNMVVSGLVQHIVSHWRLQFCKTVIAKFNCYFMLPFVDDFHRFIRIEMQRIYDGNDDNVTDIFDMTAARRALEIHRDELQSECEANKQLQDKFRLCSQLMGSRDRKNPSIFDALANSDDQDASDSDEDRI